MSSHPHFHGGGLRWFTRYEDALRAAAQENKLIFAEFSRPSCGHCRSLFELLIPDPDCAPLLQEHFVCLSVDVENPDSELMEIGTQHMPYATMLPFCFYLNPEGAFLHGSTGRLDKQVFTADLRHALNQAARIVEP
jgi:uncharacterized protein YyaL (SSP411 family)